MNDAAREAALLFVLTDVFSCQFPPHFVPSLFVAVRQHTVSRDVCLSYWPINCHVCIGLWSPHLVLPAVHRRPMRDESLDSYSPLYILLLHSPEN